MSNAAEQQYAEQGIVYLDPKMRIKNYWTQRSHSFAELRVRELNSIMADRWLREIAKYIPAGGQLRILDIGTGAGFFRISAQQSGTSCYRNRFDSFHDSGSKRNRTDVTQLCTVSCHGRGKIIICR